MAEAQARLTEEIEARTTDEVRLKEVSYQQLKLINFLQDQNDASMTLSATKVTISELLNDGVLLSLRQQYDSDRR